MSSEELTLALDPNYPFIMPFMVVIPISTFFFECSIWLRLLALVDIIEQ